jgi:hypothetical protein
VLVDAGQGLAFPACDLAGARRIALALEQQAGQLGLTIPDALDEQLHRLARMQ